MIVTLFLVNCLLSNHLFMSSKFFRVNRSKLMPAWWNVHSINFNANLLRDWVKLCAEIIRRMGYGPLAWIGLWSFTKSLTGSSSLEIGSCCQSRDALSHQQGCLCLCRSGQGFCREPYCSNNLDGPAYLQCSQQCRLEFNDQSCPIEQVTNLGNQLVRVGM